MSRRWPGEQQAGQVLPLVAALLVMCGLAAVALGHLGGQAASRARAQAAADAAALAGASEGRAGADRMAGANGGRVVRFVPVSGDVRVEVDVGGVLARAQARATSAGGVGRESDMAPAMRAVLARAAEVLGSPVPVVRVFPPGLAVEVDGPATARLLGVSDQTGLCRLDPIRAPAQFGICPPPPTALADLEGG